MSDRYLNILNCKEYLRENIDTFKKAFENYYGEEYRDLINDCFNSSTMIAYFSPKTKEKIINSALNEKTSELCNEFAKEINVDLSKEDIVDIFNFSQATITPIYNVSLLYDMLSMTEEERKEYFFNKGYNTIKKIFDELSFEEYKKLISDEKFVQELGKIPLVLQSNIDYYSDFSNSDKEIENIYGKCEDLLKKINPEININNVEDYKDLLKKIKSKYSIMIDEYSSYDSLFEKYRKEVFEETKREELIHNKYYKKLIIDNIDFVPKDEFESVMNYLNKKNDDYLDADKSKYFFGYSLKCEPPIKAFSSKQEEDLNKETTNEWIKESIKYDRINYFKLFGIDLGDNYELYLNDVRCQKIWPKKEKIDLYLEKRENILNEYNKEYYENNTDFIKTKEEIVSENLLDKDISFESNLFINEINTMVNPNIVKDGEKYKLHSLVLINLDNYDSGLIDHYIVHELNHLFELHLISSNEKQYSYISGWDSAYGLINSEEKINSIKKRSYELLNEIVNELIAQEISEKMGESNLLVFDKKESISYSNSTEYEHMLFLVKDFYEEFKETILKSRKNENIQIIWDEIGKENFDELNELFNIFYDNFSGAKIFKLVNSLNNNVDNELTSVFNELKNRRNQILENMRNYKKSKEYNVLEEFQK